MNSQAGRGWRRIVCIGPWLIAGLIILFACPLVSAQEYPTRPVRIIVPVGPGGATDIISRTLAQQLSKIWGQAVIVDNRAGGRSNIGFDVAAKSAPDGYTLLMAQPAFTVNVSLTRSSPTTRFGIFQPSVLSFGVQTSLSYIPPFPFIR
jgi:tripartite-type tricarboxylate transporter receptor subunit TctC